MKTCNSCKYFYTSSPYFYCSREFMRIKTGEIDPVFGTEVFKDGHLWDCREERRFHPAPANFLYFLIFRKTERKHDAEYCGPDGLYWEPKE